MSSWLRPTKFHHITSCSANGGPPSSTARAGLSPRLCSVETVAAGGLERQVGHVERGARDLEAPWSSSTPCSKAGSTSSVDSRTRIEIELRAEQRREGVHG